MYFEGEYNRICLWFDCGLEKRGSVDSKIFGPTI